MSECVIIVKADTTPPLYAISGSHNPQVALSSLSTYSPVAVELVHVIKSGNRSEYLERTLHIRYRSCQHHSFWFHLTPLDIHWLQQINESNFFEISGFLNKQAAPAKPEPEPEIAPEALPAFIQEQLEICERLK